MTDQNVPKRAPVRIFSRRDLVRGSAVAAGTVGLSAFGVQARSLTPEATPITVVKVLTDAERATLQAAVNCIFPADEYGPSGVESRVDVYIESSLAGWQSGVLTMYNSGLKALDTAAGPDGFSEIDASSQNELLSQLEAGELSEAPDGFFQTLLEHARQGMFADPIHGGNKNFAGWDLINYPGIKLLWTEADQALDNVVKPEHISVAKYQGDN